jgi:hypothetical protein
MKASSSRIMVTKLGITNEPAVYALYLRGDIQYVGKSVRPVNRICSHPVKFDDAQVFAGALSELGDLERQKIAELDPPLNRHHSPSTEHDKRALRYERRHVITLPNDLHRRLCAHIAKHHPGMTLKEAVTIALREWKFIEVLDGELRDKRD